MKMPLEATISAGYGFLFSRLLSIIGTIWLPYLVLIGGSALFAWLVLPHDLLHHDFSSPDKVFMLMPQFQALRGFVTLMGMIVGAMVLVHLMRHALGLKESTTWIHFSLAGPVWLMLAARLVAGIIMAVVIVVYVLVAVAVGALAFTQLHAGPAVGICALLVFIGICLIFFLAARLFFFLPAVVVAENSFGIGRAWELSKGNVWRIVLACLCILIPVWIVFGAIFGATVFPVVFSEAMHLPAHPTPEDFQPLMRAMLSILPIVLPVGIAAGIAVTGYMAGAIGAAYKAVVAAKQE